MPPTQRSVLFLLCAMAVVFGMVSANAAVLVNYTFTGSSDASVDLDLATTASQLTTTISGTQNGFNATYGNGAPSRYITGDIANQASNGNQYLNNVFFTFTLSPEAGTTSMSLTSLTFDFGASFSLSGAIGWNLNSSIGGYTSATAIASASFASNTQAANTFTAQTVNLSGAAFQNLTGPITFRLYISDSASGSSQIRFDNLVVNGTTVVPEPKTSLLLGIGLAAALAIVRRRQAPRTST